MNDKSKGWLTVIGLMIVCLLGFIAWQMHENNPQVQAEKASRAASQSEASAQMQVKQEFKDAPKGNYIHLTSDDDTLYKTNWSKGELLDFINSQSDGSEKANTLGTKHKFSSEEVDNLVNPDDNDAYAYTFEDSLKGVGTNNGDSYTAYFSSIKQAQKDKYVHQNVKHIVY